MVVVTKVAFAEIVVDSKCRGLVHLLRLQPAGVIIVVGVSEGEDRGESESFIVEHCFILKILAKSKLFKLNFQPSPILIAIKL